MTFAKATTKTLAMMLSITLIALAASSLALAQKTFDWTDAHSRAQHLVSQMTLQEKVNITTGFPADNTCAGNSGSVPRLGWPGMCLHDGGNGVRATDFVNAYPSGLHAGASWDRGLAYLRGLHMGSEFRAKGVNVLLGPNAGPLGRTPLGGRNWEGFSVDPYLSGQLNADTIAGIQDAGVIANLKHFIGNEQETHRRPYFGVEAASSNIDDKTLHEMYMWPFMDGIRAGAASIMCSYNRVNGTYACQSETLMKDILKAELGFEGFVLLDWNAQHGIDSASAGLDMVMPGQGAWGEKLTEAVRRGGVSEDRVTDMVTRIIAAWYLVGQDKDFPPPGIGMYNLTQPHEPIEARSPDSNKIIFDGAVAGHVLLKNQNGALPFSTTRPPKMLSVYGYDATVPRTKNTDVLFELGYTSSPEMADAVLGNETHFDQAARGGTIVVGGRAGANGPPYISDPLSALQDRARKDGTWLNWDLDSATPSVNAATDACIVFINAMATEGWDRTGLRDDFSDMLIHHIASTCTNTIVVVHAAGIRLVDPWIEHPNVTAAVAAHLPGQDSGRALIALLYGEENFSGKLPYTIAKDEDDYAVLESCGQAFEGDADPQCDYDEGVYLDYRDFDARNVTPRFEFGFGLSCTTFSYNSLKISQTSNLSALKADADTLWDTIAIVSARVQNTGNMAGSEVTQLYLRIPGSGSGGRGPLVRQLRGFDKTPELPPGEEAEVLFELTRRDVSVWDVNQQAWVAKDGEIGVFVGASSRDVRLEGSMSLATSGDVEEDGFESAELRLPLSHFVLLDELQETNGDEESTAWLDKFLDAKVELARFVASRVPGNRKATTYVGFDKGSFNLSYRYRFADDGPDALIRFPKPGHTMTVLRDEKVANEVEVMEYIRQNTTIPVPRVYSWGLTAESPQQFGAFIIMDYVEGTLLSDVLQTPTDDKQAPVILNPDIDHAVLDKVYYQLADYMLQLSRLILPRIGAISRVRETGECTTFTSACDYFTSLANQHMLHLHTQRNLADTPDIAQARFIARHRFRQLIDNYCTENITGPFIPFCDDLRPSNMIVYPDALAIKAVFDWEFTNAMPAQFAHDPPPEFRALYEPRMEQFLHAMEQLEAHSNGDAPPAAEPRLSARMRESWHTGRFWFNCAVKKSFEVDVIYWEALHRETGGDGTEMLDDEAREQLAPFIERKMEEVAAYDTECKARFASNSLMRGLPGVDPMS